MPRRSTRIARGRVEEEEEEEEENISQQQDQADQADQQQQQQPEEEEEEEEAEDWNSAHSANTWNEEQGENSGSETEQDGTGSQYHSQNQAALNNYFFQSLSARERERANKLSIKLVKAVMGAELKKQVISRGYLNKYVWEDDSLKEVKFEHVYKYAQGHLDKLGLELVPLSPRETSKVSSVSSITGNGNGNVTKKRKLNSDLTTSDNNSTQGEQNQNADEQDVIQDITKNFSHNASSSYILRSKLGCKYRNVIGDLIIAKSNGNAGKPDDFGPILLMICAVVLHKNNISKNELEKIVQKFGIDSFKFEHIMKKAVKEEYIYSQRITSEDHSSRRNNPRANGNSDEYAQYFLGRRTRQEFSKDGLTSLIKELYGPNFDEKKVAISLSGWKNY